MKNTVLSNLSGTSPMPVEDPVAALAIITFPHPTLRVEAKPIRKVDGMLKQLVARMFELMYEHSGVGLAATQVDLPIRLFVMNPTGRKGEGEERVLINPVITKPRGNEESEEGCLSLPNVHGNVVRAKTIHLNAFDLTGKEIDEDFSGFEARIMQHESDHLDGTLFVDRLKEGGLNQVAGELDALQTDFQSRQRTGAIESDEALLSQLKTWEERYC
ncbi:MAG: peptide deformylase [Pirellulaceae bacterium]